MSQPQLSIVVIGRNEGESLMRCLRSIWAMQFPRERYEVIYVDSNSTDGSPERAEQTGARVIPLKGRTTAARGRNAGWRAALGEFVFFVDGDTVLDAGYVAKSMPEFSNPEVAVVWGHLRETHPENSIYNRIIDLDWIYPAGWTDYCGGIAIMRRSVLLAVNGFDEHLVAGEEPELCRRIRGAGFRILHNDAFMAGHDLAMMHFSQYWRRGVRSGYAYAQVATRYAGTADPFWSAEAKRNRAQGFIYVIAPLLAVVLSASLLSFWPVLALLLGAVLIVVRTAARAAHRSSRLGLRLLYSLHSHFVQIPIFFGQAGFLWKHKGDKAAAPAGVNPQ